MMPYYFNMVLSQICASFGLRPLMGLIQGMVCSPVINRAWLRIEPRDQVAELPCDECNGR